jgi:lysyl-tRNA synthetase class 2
MDAIRSSLNKKGFLEVETPILSTQYGGANARPFSSHLNALDVSVYMRISNELFLKRLIMGGFEKVYEFSKDFRNEGIDRSHNPEFTQIEIYEAHKDLYDVMDLTEELILNSLNAVDKKAPIKWGENTINLKAPFERLRMVDAIEKHAKIDVKDMSVDDLKAECKKQKVEIAGESRGMLILSLFEGLVEDKLIDPVFITEHPKETTPLCKVSREDPDFVERFELFIGGMEFANAYSELNDPIRQKELLEEQAQALRGGSEEAHPMDEDFVEAMEYGMPPTGGVGIGIDRLIMLLCDQHSIRDVLLFPFMKPLAEDEPKKEK